MALLLSKSVFYHVPKTGGGWVRSVLNRNGVQHPELHSYHTTAKLAPPPEGYFAFAFVRDPRAWYQSYWTYRMLTNWEDMKGMDTNCYSENFQEFVWNCTQKYPGYVSNMYRHHVGNDASNLDFVGKQECLVEDLITALRLAGEEDYEEEAIRAAPPINEGAALSEWNEKCQYTPELLAAVEESESWAMEMFDYA